MKALRIRNWERHYENNRTREMVRMSWVPIPNRLDSDGYVDLLDHPDGAAHFGAWIACVEVASRCRPRGALVRDSRTPHDVTTIARITRIPPAVIQLAIQRLIAIGWLEECEIPAEVPQASRTLTAGSPRKSAPSGRKEGRKEVSESARADSVAAPKQMSSDAVARRLQTVLGSSLRPCRAQVAALLEAGMTLDAIAHGIGAHGAPGLAPWDWTRAVQAGLRRADAPKEDPACVECRTAPRAPGRALCTACLTPPDRAAAAGAGAEPVTPVRGAHAPTHRLPRARARTPAVDQRGA